MRTSFASLLLIALLVASFCGCAPAKWKEQLSSDVSNGTSGSPVSSPQSQPATESFVQDNTANKVDILIINDNSASMDPEQRKMSERFASFISELEGIDYRIAMTTTDVESPNWNQGGRILTWSGTSSGVLTSTTKDAEKKFRKTVARPETIGCQKRNDCPSGNEQPLRALELAIDQHATANKDFFRDGVDLVTVVLSDEDEMSNSPPQATSAADVISHFASVFGTTKRLEVHGLIVEPGDVACRDLQNAQIPGGNAAYYGTHVSELASLTGGTVNSICDEDYSKDLQAISSEVRRLVSTFELHHVPKDNSVIVTFIPAFTTKWTVEGNKIFFNPAPPAGTKFDISYKY